MQREWNGRRGWNNVSWANVRGEAEPKKRKHRRRKSLLPKPNQLPDSVAKEQNEQIEKYLKTGKVDPLQLDRHQLRSMKNVVPKKPLLKDMIADWVNEQMTKFVIVDGWVDLDTKDLGETVGSTIRISESNLRKKLERMYKNRH